MKAAYHCRKCKLFHSTTTYMARNEFDLCCGFPATYTENAKLCKLFVNKMPEYIKKWKEELDK